MLIYRQTNKNRTNNRKIMGRLFQNRQNAELLQAIVDVGQLTRYSLQHVSINFLFNLFIHGVKHLWQLTKLSKSFGEASFVLVFMCRILSNCCKLHTSQPFCYTHTYIHTYIFIEPSLKRTFLAIILQNLAIHT